MVGFLISCDDVKNSANTTDETLFARNPRMAIWTRRIRTAWSLSLKIAEILSELVLQHTPQRATVSVETLRFFSKGNYCIAKSHVLFIRWFATFRHCSSWNAKIFFSRNCIDPLLWIHVAIDIIRGEKFPNSIFERPPYTFHALWWFFFIRSFPTFHVVGSLWQGRGPNHPPHHQRKDSQYAL